LEDESITAFNLEETLNKIGYKNVDVALNVEAAEEIAETKEFDLLLLDINVGRRYSGIDFAAAMKAKKEDLPVMFLTGNSDSLTVARASTIEPRAFLIKPISEHEVKVNLDLIFQQAPKSQISSKTKNELRFSKTFLDNHPNLVLRIDVSGLVMFANPVLSRVIGKDPDSVINKNVDDCDLHVSVMTLIRESLANAEKKKRKFSGECTINTIMGDRMMFVATIPELDDEKRLMSIILMMQDITDQKIATEDLILRNKKIVDSINYSRKIQQALLPSTHKLQHYLPDSFILLKPKDTVSGDFPWVYRRGDHLYIAAVDCTGHGVPGALLSVIVHFLLNEIMRMKEDILPGRALELLHLYTKRTLKQHMPGIESNDGADIALCRVNLKTHEICYSGAHRPMFYTKGDEVLEVKGDRQPIGGEQYSKRKRRLVFSNTFIEGDADTKVIIFSDGLSDQFGGADHLKRKFGSLQIRKVMENSRSLSSIETLEQMDKEFVSWKAEQKQLDDVLAVCFRMSNTQD
jgi:PAS domain S-box-containing protein